MIGEFSPISRWPALMEKALPRILLVMAIPLTLFSCLEDVTPGATAEVDMSLIRTGHRGNEWVKVDHLSLKSAAASRSAPSAGDIPRPAAHRRDAA
jgi:hypothetical protein